MLFTFLYTSEGNWDTNCVECSLGVSIVPRCCCGHTQLRLLYVKCLFNHTRLGFRNTFFLILRNADIFTSLASILISSLRSLLLTQLDCCGSHMWLCIFVHGTPQKWTHVKLLQWVNEDIRSFCHQ